LTWELINFEAGAGGAMGNVHRESGEVKQQKPGVGSQESGKAWQDDTREIAVESAGGGYWLPGDR
jgi:hypothetical protein